MRKIYRYKDSKGNTIRSLYSKPSEEVEGWSSLFAFIFAILFAIGLAIWG
jgi:hypothetical protein